jgi:hypothetical protein
VRQLDGGIDQPPSINARGEDVEGDGGKDLVRKLQRDEKFTIFQQQFVAGGAVSPKGYAS